MLAQTHKSWMDVLNSSPVFNTGGWLTVSGSVGLGIGKWFDVINLDIWVGIIVGIFSTTYLIMRIYKTYLETKEYKRKLRKRKDDNVHKDK